MTRTLVRAAAVVLLLSGAIIRSHVAARQADRPGTPSDLCEVIQAIQRGTVFRAIAFDPTLRCTVDYLQQGRIDVQVQGQGPNAARRTPPEGSPVPGIGENSFERDSDGYAIQFIRSCFFVSISDQIDTTRGTSDPGRHAARDVALVKRIATALDQKLAALPCPDDERLPVIFIPGVAGTNLVNSVGLGLWPLAKVGDRAGLALAADGRTSANGSIVRTGDIMWGLGVNFYGGFVDFMAGLGYKTGTDFFLMPYDWRLDNAAHFTQLDALVKNAIERSGKKKVLIVAHSMGGVIARAYVYSTAARAADVSAFITLGTPYWGAPKVYYGAINGYQFGNPTVRQELMKILIQNYPAGYQLFPKMPFIRDAAKNDWMSLQESNTVRYKWFEGVTYGVFRDSYDVTSSNSQVFNAALLKQADDFFASVGGKDRPRPLPGGVKQYAIIGTGVATLGSYTLHDFEAGPGDFFFGSNYLEIGSRKVVMHPVMEDGDGTVPLWSLETDAATASYYLTTQAGGSTAHAALTDNTIAQSIVALLLKNKPPNTAEYARPQQYGPTRQPITPGIVLEAASEFELHSDAHLKLAYPNGSSLGFNDEGGIDERAPGTFLSMDGIEYAAVAGTAGTYDAVVTGLQTGKFTLDVKMRGRSGTSRFSYVEVPVQKGTVAKIALTGVAANAPPTMTVTTGGQTTRVAATPRGGASTTTSTTATTTTTTTTTTIPVAIRLTMEPNIDRPGSDYGSAALGRSGPEACRDLCGADPRCLAYTYVRPGVQGPSSMCWLKDAVPAPVPGATYAVSGVKSGGR